MYLCFAWGLPLIAVGINVLVQLDELGNDPRCMVGWINEAKLAFFIPMIGMILVSTDNTLEYLAKSHHITIVFYLFSVQSF